MLSCFSHVQLFLTLTIACQAPVSMEFSRQEYSSRLPCPAPGDLSDLGIEPVCPVSPAWKADPLSTEPPGKPRNIPHNTVISRHVVGSWLILCVKEWFSA